MLQKMRYVWIPAKEKYGNAEKSYVIFNVELSDMKWLFDYENFDQGAFVYGKKVFNEEKGEFEIDFSYFEKSSGKSEHKALETIVDITNQDVAEDFFTQFKNFKFNMPFTFEDIEGGEKILDKYFYKEDFYARFTESLNSERTMKSRAFQRKFLYDTKEEQELRESKINYGRIEMKSRRHLIDR